MEANGKSASYHQTDQIPALIELQGALEVVAEQEKGLDEMEVGIFEDVSKDDAFGTLNKGLRAYSKVLLLTSTAEFLAICKNQVDNGQPRAAAQSRLVFSHPEMFIVAAKSSLVQEGIQQVDALEIRVNQLVGQLPRRDAGCNMCVLEVQCLCLGRLERAARARSTGQAGRVRVLLGCLSSCDPGDELERRGIPKVSVGLRRGLAWSNWNASHLRSRLSAGLTEQNSRQTAPHKPGVVRICKVGGARDSDVLVSGRILAL